MDLQIKKFEDITNVGEYVYNIIKSNILNLNLAPGNRISEQEISNILNVSRTPVREAFIKLSREGLVYVLPQRGTYISYIDLEQVEEVRFIRESLECAVISIAAKNFPQDSLKILEENFEKQKEQIKKKLYMDFFELDQEFHKIIFDACSKQRTWKIIEQISTQYTMVRILSFIGDVNWDKVIDQHYEILQSIKEQNVEKANTSMSNHLKKILVDEIELKKMYDYFK